MPPSLIALCSVAVSVTRRYLATVWGPEIVLGDQGIYLGIMATIAFIALQAGATGSLLIPIAVVSGNVVSPGRWFSCSGGGGMMHQCR